MRRPQSGLFKEVISIPSSSGVRDLVPRLHGDMVGWRYHQRGKWVQCQANLCLPNLLLEGLSRALTFQSFSSGVQRVSNGIADRQYLDQLGDGKLLLPLLLTLASTDYF